MFTKKMIAFQDNDTHMPLVDKNKTIQVPTILVSEKENKSVIRTVHDFVSDIKKVTGEMATINHHPSDSASRRVILIGTIENSAYIKDLNTQGKIDISTLEGKWESFLIEVIKKPSDDIDEMLVIAGSDSRGAIYGMYHLSEEMGVSPWYWWMDVPVKQQEKIYISRERLQQGEPSVKYRGFFINDEGPSLMTWVRSKYGDFTHEFYARVFELTLRLKANYHWPAMWDSTFYEDDERNAETADLYGVVMGTSHHEPMGRPHTDWKRHRNGAWDYQKNEHVLYDFWDEGIERNKDYENILTLGMRGDGDEEMGGDLTFQGKVQLMDKIIADQREIISRHHNKPAAEVPQLWALYKEVTEYYAAGLTVPDDVTLLWSDDNFGNIRRVPTEQEQKRSGGAGIYYHLDYVGGPRSYKWVNTVPIPKIWEQMHKAYTYGADRIWILNVGDIKPMEFQMTFFLKMAWNMDDFTPDNLWDYSVAWAGATFGEEWAEKIAEVIYGYTKMNGRIKPEHLNKGPLYSLDHYDEAKTVLEEFQKIVDTAEEIWEGLPEAYKDAFFQLAYYPAKASLGVLKMYVLSALNKQYAEEGRLTANALADEVEDLFEKDKELTERYHQTSSGKWNDMMLQTHIGYTYWQQPEENVMPEVVRIKPSERGRLVIGETRHTTLNNLRSREGWFELFQTGEEPIGFEIESSHTWLSVDEAAGHISTQQRITIKVDWDQLKGDLKKEGTVTVVGKDGSIHHLEVSAESIQVDQNRTGHIETDGYISMEAAHYTKNSGLKEIPHYGRTQSSMAFIPSVEKKNDELMLEYSFYTQNKGTKDVILLLAPSLPYLLDADMTVSVSIDEGDASKIQTVTMNGIEPEMSEWEKSVTDNIRKVTVSFAEISKGWHTLRIQMNNPTIVLQKIVIDSGGLKESFLGAPESYYIEKGESDD